MNNAKQDSCRIDKWLWAARFFKTRNLAKQAIEGGKVHYNGQRIKTSKLVETGAVLTIRCGWDEKTVEILRISDQRRGAPEAQTLYSETEESIAKRQAEAAARKAAGQSLSDSGSRPSKKQRRQIHRFQRKSANSDTLSGALEDPERD